MMELKTPSSVPLLSLPSLQSVEMEDPCPQPTLPKNEAPTAQKSTDSSFPFLDLAAEIRNKIYKVLLVQDKPINIYKCYRPPFVSSSDPEIRLPGTPRTSKPLKNGILGVNKKINLEAMAILYQYNTFIIGNQMVKEASLDVLKHFIARVPPAGVSLISKVHLLIKFNRLGSRDKPKDAPTAFELYGASPFYAICTLLENSFKGLKHLTIVTDSLPEYNFGRLCIVYYGDRSDSPDANKLPGSKSGKNWWKFNNNMKKAESLFSTGIEMILRSVPDVKVEFRNHLQLRPSERKSLYNAIFNEHVRRDYAIEGDMKVDTEDDEDTDSSEEELEIIDSSDDDEEFPAFGRLTTRLSSV